MLCAVNDAVFFVKAFDRALPGTIGVGMMQRLAGNMMLDTPLPVLPFSPPRGARLPLASIVMEVDLMGKGGEVRTDRVWGLATHNGLVLSFSLHCRLR